MDAERAEWSYIKHIAMKLVAANGDEQHDAAPIYLYSGFEQDNVIEYPDFM